MNTKFDALTMSLARTSNRRTALKGLFGGAIAFAFGGKAVFATDAANGVCRLDKVGTFAEVNGAGPQRIEVGGSATQHVDFYPASGVRSVSYIVPALKSGASAAIWTGFGSIWQGSDPDCQSFDYIADASGYAEARSKSNGHSGLVVDLRESPAVVYNTAGMNQDDVVALLKQDAASMSNGAVLNGVKFDGGGAVSNTTGAAKAASTAAASTTTGTVQCPPGYTCTKNSPSSTPAANSGTTKTNTNNASCQGVRSDHDPVVGEDWVLDPGNGVIVANVWSNAHDTNMKDHKILVKGKKVTLTSGGGAAWQYGKGCETAAQASYDSNPNPPITLAEFNDYVQNGN